MIVQVAATTKWYQVMMGRWVAGLGVGALSLLVPMYQAETAPRHIRGALIRFVTTSAVSGNPRY